MASRTNIQRTIISSSASGNVTIIANPSTTARLYIWELALVVGGAANLQFFDGAGAITGVLAMLANGSIFFPDDNPGNPRFVISPGQSFIVNDNTGVAKGGYVVYSN